MGSGTQDCYMQHWVQELLHILPTSHYKLTDMPQRLERAASPPSPHLSCQCSQLLLSATPTIETPLWTFKSQHPHSVLLVLAAYLWPLSHLPSSCLLRALSAHLPLLSPVSLPCRPHHWLHLPELIAPQLCLQLNSLLSQFLSPQVQQPQHCALSLSLCSFPFLTLPYPELLRSLMASKTPLIFSWPLDLFFFPTDNLIFAQLEFLYPTNEFPPTLGYL